MLASLAALVVLQSIDSAAGASQRRLVDLPEAEQQVEAGIEAATGEVEAARVRVQEGQAAHRALEKDVAAVDTRLARFEDHRAAVKTNQEYTALLHEIATAKAEKEAIEERILLLMEEADDLTASLKAAEDALRAAKRDAEAARAGLAAERVALETGLKRLAEQRAGQRAQIDARALAIYDQLLRNRRGIAVAPMEHDICGACHVRLRPHVTQMIRRNDAIVQCESCQRILYYQPPAEAAAAAASS